MSISKEKAINDFFRFYASEICAELLAMSDEELTEYVSNDIFVGCASAASGIDEWDFVEAAPSVIACLREEASND